MNYGDARLPERFWNKVIPEPMGGCWLWLGSASKRGTGIGQIRGNNRTYSVHAFAWLAAGGAPSEAILHTCGVGCCVNPAHLIAGQLGETSKLYWARQYTPTRCVHGHELTEENTYVLRHGNRYRRICKPCHIAMARLRSAEHFAATLRRARSPARRQQILQRRAQGKRSWQTRRLRYGPAGGASGGGRPRAASDSP